MNIRIKDLAWDHNNAFERAAAPGVSCHYIVSKDEYSKYDAYCILTEVEVKYVKLGLGTFSTYEEACNRCNEHHKERLCEIFLEKYE